VLGPSPAQAHSRAASKPNFGHTAREEGAPFLIDGRLRWGRPEIRRDYVLLQFDFAVPKPAQALAPWGATAQWPGQPPTASRLPVVARRGGTQRSRRSARWIGRHVRSRMGGSDVERCGAESGQGAGSVLKRFSGGRGEESCRCFALCTGETFAENKHQAAARTPERQGKTAARAPPPLSGKKKTERREGPRAQRSFVDRRRGESRPTAHLLRDFRAFTSGDSQAFLVRRAFLGGTWDKKQTQGRPWRT